MISLIFVFIGLVALVKGKLQVTARSELSAWRARAIGLGFLVIACLLEVTVGTSDEQLGVVIAAAAERGHASTFLTDANDVRMLLMALAIGAGMALAFGAFLLARDGDPRQPSPAQKRRPQTKTPATRSKRLCCWLLDSALLLSPAFVVLGVAKLIDRDSPHDIEQVSPVIGLTSIAIYVLQCALTASTGQSLAKGWFGIRITRPEGASPGFVRGVVVRSWLPAAALGLALVWPFLGFLALFNALRIFGSQAQCLHDLLADTIVVNVAERSRAAALPASVR